MNRRSPAPLANREAIKSSAEFRAFVEEQQTEAQRRKDDRLKAISDKRDEITRAEEDHATFVLQTKREISDIQELISDDDVILTGAALALGQARPAPQLVPHSEVEDALNQESVVEGVVK